MPSPDELRDWAASGAMWLTGRPDGPPLLPPGRGASMVRESLVTLGIPTSGPSHLGPGLLGERAAYAGLSRNAPWSCGGAFRALPAADGWIGLSLARPSDVDLVPALVEGPVEDPWSAVGAWATRVPAAAADERMQLLGLPGGAIAATPPRDRPGVVTTALGRREPTERPLVVDLTSLWAGPLCAHLLGLTGARIVKVESTQRPDGARSTPTFFDLLHGGHEQVSLDLGGEVDRLRSLIAGADLVLEASRPRALRQLGIVAEDVVAAGTSWLSITARGRASGAVGFGDDVAATGGLVVADREELLPTGDAIADPLTGVAAAVAARAALDSDEARLVDVSMRHVVAETLDGPPGPGIAAQERGGAWWLDTGAGAVRVERPRTR